MFRNNVIVRVLTANRLLLLLIARVTNSQVGRVIH